MILYHWYTSPSWLLWCSVNCSLPLKWVMSYCWFLNLVMWLRTCGLNTVIVRRDSKENKKSLSEKNHQSQIPSSWFGLDFFFLFAVQIEIILAIWKNYNWLDDSIAWQEIFDRKWRLFARVISLWCHFRDICMNYLLRLNNFMSQIRSKKCRSKPKRTRTCHTSSGTSG